MANERNDGMLPGAGPSGKLTKTPARPAGPAPRPGGAPTPTLCRGQGCGVQVVFLPSQASDGKRFVCASLPGVKMFVMVRKDDDLRLADQEAIDAGQALARQVTVYGSHHAAYKPIPACTQAATFRRPR